MCMSNIIFSSYRQWKINVIYLFLFLMIILSVSFFRLAHNYLLYNLNYVFGTLEENRGYVLYTENEILVEHIQDEFCLEKVEINYSFDIQDGYYVVLDKYRDTNKFTEYLKKKDIAFNLFSNEGVNDIKIANKNIKIFNFLEIICIFIILVIMSYILENVFYNEQKNLAVLKTIGYRNVQIFLIIFCKVCILFVCSYIISFLILYIVKILCILFSGQLMTNFLKITSVYKIVSIAALISNVALLFNSIPYIKKINKMNVFTILEE